MSPLDLNVGPTINCHPGVLCKVPKFNQKRGSYKAQREWAFCQTFLYFRVSEKSGTTGTSTNFTECIQRAGRYLVQNSNVCPLTCWWPVRVIPVIHAASLLKFSYHPPNNTVGDVSLPLSLWMVCIKFGPPFCWDQHSAGTNHLLGPTFRWNQPSAGITLPLGPTFRWNHPSLPHYSIKSTLSCFDSTKINHVSEIRKRSKSPVVPDFSDTLQISIYQR